jgi:hypothetical protein
MLGCRITCKREQLGLSACACVGSVHVYDKGQAPAEWDLGDNTGLTASLLPAVELLPVGGAASKRSNSKPMKCGAVAQHKPRFPLELTSCVLVVVSARFVVRAKALFVCAFSLFPRALAILALPARPVAHAISKRE